MKRALILMLMLAANLMDGRPDATLTAVMLALALGAGVGAATGLLDGLLRVNSLILTLGTLTVLPVPRRATSRCGRLRAACSSAPSPERKSMPSCSRAAAMAA